MPFSQKLAINTRVVLGFLLTILIITVLGTFYYVNTKEFVEVLIETEKSNIKTKQLERTISFLREVESNQRGHLITGDKLYLGAFYLAIDQLENEMNLIRSDIRSDQKATLNKIQVLIMERLRMMHLTIELSNKGDNKAVINIVKTNRGRFLMNEIASLVNGIIHEEDENTKINKGRIELQAYKILIIIIAGIAFILIIIFVNLIHILKEVRDGMNLKNKLEISNLNLVKASNITSTLNQELAASNEEINAVNEELKAANEDLNKAFEDFKTLNDFITDAQNFAHLGIWEKNLKTNIVYRSDELYRIYGYDPKKIPNDFELPYESIPAFEREIGRKNYNQILVDHKPYDYEHSIILPSGEIRKIYGRAKITLDESGAPWKVTAISLDVTALVRSEERYKLLAENSSDIICRLTPDRKIIYISPSCKQIFGYEPNELIGKSVTEIIYADDLEFIKEALKNDLHTTESRISCVRIVKKDGGHIWVETISKTIFDPKTNEIIEVQAASRDITDRKEAQDKLKQLNDELEITIKERTKELRESEEEFRLLATASTEMIWESNGVGEIEDMPRWREFTGQTLDEVKGFGWLNALHPDDHENTSKTWNEAVDKKHLYEATYRIRSKEGVYHYFFARGVPMLDENGEIKKWIGTFYDVHDKIIAEKNLQDIYLKSNIQNDKLTKMNEVLDTFVFAAAHDLKSPVNNLKSLITLLDSSISPKESVMIYKALQESIIRLDHTISSLSQLIDIQNNESIKLETIEFDKMTNLIEEELAGEINEVNATIIKDFTSVSHINYVEAYLYSVMLNMINNAIKYRNHEVSLKVALKTQLIDGFILLTVEDNGIGIDLIKNEKNIFRPFKRLSNQAGGKGIGLYLIKSMVEKNGGHVKVESEEGKGTIFKIFLKDYSNEMPKFAI